MAQDTDTDRVIMVHDIQIIGEHLVSNNLDQGAQLAAQYVYDNQFEMNDVLHDLYSWNEDIKFLNEMRALGNVQDFISPEAFRRFKVYYECLSKLGYLPRSSSESFLD